MEDDRNGVGDDNNKNKTMSLTSPASPRNQTNEPRPQTTCEKCGITGDAFMMKIHIKNCEAGGDIAVPGPD